MSTATLSPPSAPAAEPPPSARPLASLPVVAALLTVLAGIVAGGLYLVPQAPAEDSVEVGFARDMSAHHAQAVAMAESLRDRTDDPQLRTLAADIALTQQAQIGMMRAWLDDWGRTPTTSGPRMAWMGMPTDGLMPGMASAQDQAELGTLPVEQAEVRFLQLMVQHHTGGVAMARAGSAMAQDPQVVALADSIAAGQTAEIEYLQSLLAARGQPPVDTSAAAGMQMGQAGHDTGSGPALRDVVLLSVVAVGIAAFAWLLVDTLAGRLSVPAGRPGAVVVLLALAALVTAAVHLVLTPSHAAQSAGYGLFFLLSALVAAAGAAAALVLPRVGAAVVGGLGALLIAVYVLFRIVPPPGAEAPEDVDAWGVTALVAELAAVALAVAVLRVRSGRAVPATR